MGRRALVLGSGGLLGAAWTIGALTAAERVLGRTATDVDIVLGTSAGAVVAALLAGGVTPGELAQQQRGELPATGPLAALGMAVDPDVGGRRPPLPLPRPGSVRLLRHAVAAHDSAPGALLAGLIPLGRGSLGDLSRLLGRVAPAWPARPALRVVALDYDTGRRACFTGPADRVAAPTGGFDPVLSPDLPPTLVTSGVPIGVAVQASCAIPGWFAPVAAGGRRFVDAGAVSTASLDLLAGEDLAEVLLLAPLASVRYDRPRGPVTRLERWWRRHMTRRLLAEVALLRRRGVTVTTLLPGPRDLAVFGANAMDVRRRVPVLETSVHTATDQLRRRRRIRPAT